MTKVELKTQEGDYIKFKIQLLTGSSNIEIIEIEKY